VATANEMTLAPGAPEVRLERMRFEEVEAALSQAPIAWLPVGALG
jgi:hypothetical protein